MELTADALAGMSRQADGEHQLAIRAARVTTRVNCKNLRIVIQNKRAKVQQKLHICKFSEKKVEIFGGFKKKYYLCMTFCQVS